MNQDMHVCTILLAEWQAQYAPSKEQAEEDRAKAYAAGVPHGNGGLR